MKYVAVIFIFIVILYYSYPVVFGPSQVIDDVVAVEEEDSIVVQINFNVPIRYEDHFPKESGELVQIKFRLISLKEAEFKEVLVGSKAIRPELAKKISLANISYEGNVPGGPFLTLLFTKNMTYKVRESESLQSLILVFPKPSVQQETEVTSKG